MRRVFLAVAGVLAATSLAEAADLSLKAPPAPVAVSNWTAVYIGGYVGGSWANAHFCGFSGGATCNDLSVNGVVGGGYIGFDYELPNRVVVGARLSAPFGSLNSDNNAPLGFGAPGTTVSAKFNWAVMASGTVGYDMGQWMPYVGAGVALASVDATISSPAGLTSTATGQEQIGVNFLAGIKYALTRNWAFGVQYNHIEFERVNYFFTGPLGSAVLGSQAVQLRQDSVVGTVDFRF
jgi:outer membrane immunogenic protein